MKKKEDLRVVKTKANLYRGLMELMKDQTFEEIKVSDICNKSMINRSTFMITLMINMNCFNL